MKVSGCSNRAGFCTKSISGTSAGSTSAATAASPMIGLGVVASTHPLPFGNLVLHHPALIISLTTVASKHLKESMEEDRLKVLDKERSQSRQEVLDSCLRRSRNRSRSSRSLNSSALPDKRAAIAGPLLRGFRTFVKSHHSSTASEYLNQLVVPSYPGGTSVVTG